jgi:hypothetical protein
VSLEFDVVSEYATLSSQSPSVRSKVSQGLHPSHTMFTSCFTGVLLRLQHLVLQHMLTHLQMLDGHALA